MSAGWGVVIGAVSKIAEILEKIYTSSREQALLSVQPQLQAYAESKLAHIRNMQKEIEQKKVQLASLTSGKQQFDYTRLAMYLASGVVIGILIAKVVKK